tara:strand:+ start:10953 stop:11174 length:222 start_codon:yes stop_codon:yes gene_type:complete
MNDVEQQLDDLRSRLMTIADELTDLGIAAIQAAIDEDGAQAQRPELEKRLSRARRSVEKAAAIIGHRPESTTI